MKQKENMKLENVPQDSAESKRSHYYYFAMLHYFMSLLPISLIFWMNIISLDAAHRFFSECVC